MLQPLFKTCALEQAAVIKLQHCNQHSRPLGVNLYKTRSQYKRAGGYFRRANGDIRQMKEAATEPASMVEPTQRFKGFSLLFNALPA